MPKDWLDVADTAVKIGLGSLITGVFTYLGVQFSHKSEKNKFMLEHKTKLLELIATDIEVHFSAWDFYISRIAGIARNREINDKENIPLTTTQKDSIKEFDLTLVESWSNRESAISKLRLMNASKASSALSSCKTLQKEIRDRVIFNKEVPTRVEVAEYRSRVIAKKEEVHKALAEFYALFGV